MNTENWSTVKEIVYEDQDIQLLNLTDTHYPVILYKRFSTAVTKGTYVKVNTTATTLQLGTGGVDIVKEVLASSFKQKPLAPGHIMKLRYTPAQQAVTSIEEVASPYHDLFHQPFTLNQKKILLGELHSMIPLVCYLTHEFASDLTCCVIFDDSASLALEMSDHVRRLKKEPWFTSITCGQCVGGDYEAINLLTALQFAVDQLHADLIMISVGPGVVGTGTSYGFSAVEMANWANLVGALQGRPIWIPRLSFKEKRQRHYGLSHHTITPLYDLTLAETTVVFPFMNESQRNYIQDQLNRPSQIKHHLYFLERECDSNWITRAFKHVGSLSTMGRTYADDPLFFEAIAASVSFVLAEENTS
ncbi:DUF3866 family protein [Alkalicoccobacillus porphyridii]|uniref:DUF3866 family protein n=1 Tax=Alkalicoccobacillus porphyridii TaxID=2597270 RepID=A0A553ZYW6_9BACI|nr:DUF3866 family protein [Alkalicoccobacillus porphyridii]TSB46576.1 DUF3866 family protein [Alkalicoccobacillus porphyridii]